MALTTWHLIFATIATQVMARTTPLLNGLQNVNMSRKTYIRAILPIGAAFSISLICSNQAYLTLSVAFIQMLKAITPVAVLLASWILAVEEPNLKKLGNVTAIVVGVIIASYGEIEFNVSGFIFQTLGIAFEATRLVMVQRLLSGADLKMDPLCSLYYFAPICAVFNGLMCVVFEGHSLSLQAIADIGALNLIMNASTALALNIAVVFLIGKTSSLVLTLAGVMKDILLVCASILIWRTPVTFTQFFGFSIALAGLLYYKLGPKTIRDIMGSRSNPLPRTKQELLALPAWKKAITLGVSACLGLLCLIVIVGTDVMGDEGIKRRDLRRLKTLQ